MTWSDNGLPNPGSDEAQAAGCRCAVLDNNHGKRPPRPPDGWWVTVGCPVHAPNEPKPPKVVVRQGLVVIARRWQKATKAMRKAGTSGWTLHREDCVYVRRTKKVMPAPIDPYPGTVSCVYCRPDGEDQERRKSGVAAERVSNPRRMQRHPYDYEQVGGQFKATCRACGITGVGSTADAARSQGYRHHRAAQLAAAGAP